MRLMCFALAACAFAQPAFDTASVKPSTSGGASSSWTSREGRVEMKNMTLAEIVAAAFGVKDQYVSGPAWIAKERYDITAKAAEVLPNDELMKMLQMLLTEKFRLVAHRETRVVPGLALVVAGGGLKLSETDAGDGPRTNITNNKMVAERASMARLADVISRLLEIPVVDATGRGGVFNLTVEWPKEAGAAPDAISKALEATAGLRLEKRSVPVTAIVADRAEKIN